MSLDEIKAQILAITPTKECFSTQEFKEKNIDIINSMIAIKSGRLELFAWLNDEKFSDNCFMRKLIGNFLRNELLGSDDKKVISHYKKAYELGYPCLAYSIGVIYYYSNTIEKNYVKAMKWFMRSIENKYNYMNSFWYIGNMYELGLGVRIDYMKSNHYLEMGFEKPDAMNTLGMHYMNGDSEGKFTDHELAKKFFLKAVEMKNYYACWNLGVLYCEVILPRTEDNCRIGFGWFHKALENNDADWMEELGLKYARREFVITDDAEALRLLLISAEANVEKKDNYEALSWIGCLYSYGVEGVKPDVNLSVIWHQGAIDKGSIDALWNMGMICVDQGKKMEAVNYFLEAYKKYPEVENKMFCKEEIKQIMLDDDDMSVLCELISSWKESKTLVEENERLSAELSFRPDGSGYVAAKEHFECSVKN
ncbi:MAG: tetratricopeptide repeat protein [Harvfovirus sp.]|uniref:Tetratricopeptide repeat protein n=1 Tax=Harvfovirus sp. TaxID=2487768 RepID=A0A3G5A296_9VIRU|nr:MAG: tetratricopeptide repeat protein [Harvfovirus sp.]